MLSFVLSLLSLFAPAPNPTGPRVDALGDPLPPGAVARFGSIRWRYVGPTSDLQFSPDGRFLAQVHDAFSITVWHYPEGRAAFRFQFTAPTTPNQLTDLGVERPPARIRFSPDSRSLFAFGGLGELYRVRLPDGSRMRLTTIESHLLPAAVSADGRRVVADEPVSLPDGRLATHVLVRGTNEGRWRRIDTRYVADERALPQFDAALAMSPDGRFVAVADYCSSIQVWVRTRDLETGTSWQMPCWNLAALRFSPDGRSLLGLGSQIWLWQIRERPGGKPGMRLCGGFAIPDIYPVRADSAHFTPDGRRIVVGYQGGVQVRDARDMRLLGECDVAGYEIEKIAVAADGRTLALATTYDESVLSVVRFIDLATGRPMARTTGHSVSVDNLQVSPDGRRLLSRTSRGDTFVWDTLPRTGRGLPGAYRFASLPVQELDFVATRVRMVAADRLLIWGHEEADSPAATDHGSLWSLGAGLPRRLARVPVWSDDLLAFRPNAKELAACGQHGRLGRFDLRTGNRVGKELRTVSGASMLAYAEDGQRLQVGVRGEPDAVFDLGTGKPITGPVPPTGVPDRYRVQHDGPGRRLVVTEGSDPRPVRVLQAPGPDTERDEPKPPSRPAAVSAAGRLVAYLFGGGARVLDLDTGELMADLRAPALASCSLAFLPCGDFLAVGYHDGQVLLWDVRPQIGKGVSAFRECWDNLGRDVNRSRAAEATLRRYPAIARIIFDGRLRLMRVPSVAEIEEQVTRLDHPRYAVREAATNWLERYRDDALPILKRTEKGRSAEAIARIERLLAPPGPERSADVLRAFRAVSVLEAIGGAEADELLRRVAAGGGLPAVRARDALARRTPPK